MSLVLDRDYLTPPGLRCLPDSGKQLALRRHDLFLVEAVKVKGIIGKRVLLVRNGRKDFLVLPLHTQLQVRKAAAGVLPAHLPALFADLEQEQNFGIGPSRRDERE